MMGYTTQEYKILEGKYKVLLTKYEEIETERDILMEKGEIVDEEYKELMADYSRRVKEVHELKMEKMKWEHYLQTQVQKNRSIVN